MARLGSKNALNSFTWLHLASPGTPNSDSLTTYWPEFLLRPDLHSVRSPLSFPWPSLGHQIPIFRRSQGQNCPRTPTMNTTWAPNQTETNWNQQALALQRSWVDFCKQPSATMCRGGWAKPLAISLCIFLPWHSQGLRKGDPRHMFW